MEDSHCTALDVAGQPHSSKRQEAQKACRIPEGSRGKNLALTPAQACNTRMKETKPNSTKAGDSTNRRAEKKLLPQDIVPNPMESPGKGRLLGGQRFVGRLSRNSCFAVISN